MIDAIFSALNFFLIVSGSLLWLGFLVVVVFYFMTRDGDSND